jgi:hypothetical protein
MPGAIVWRRCDDLLRKHDRRPIHRDLPPAPPAGEVRAVVESAVLLNGDEVQIGKFRLVFSTER